MIGTSQQGQTYTTSTADCSELAQLCWDDLAGFLHAKTAV